MFQLNKNYLQKYVRDYIKENKVRDDLKRFYYEVTITFNQQYWSLQRAIDCVEQVIADILKPVIRSCSSFGIRYCVEYHANGYPHIHAQVLVDSELPEDIQRAIHCRLIKRYGRSQWYQTGEEDKIHINEKYPEGIRWSEYIKKDVRGNELNGKRHYFEYTL